MSKCLNDLTVAIKENHTVNNKRRIGDCQEGQSGDEFKTLTVITNDVNQIPEATPPKRMELMQKMRGFKTKKWTVLAMLYEEWEKVYVRVLNNKNTKDVDRLVRLSGDIACASDMVEKEMEISLKPADNEKYVKAQEILKQMFNDLNESFLKIVNVPKTK